MNTLITHIGYVELALLVVGLTSMIFSIAALGYVLSMLKELQKQRSAVAKALDRLEKEVEVVNTGSRGVGQRLLEVEKQLKRTSEKQQALEEQDLGSISYSQAARLTQLGAEVDEIVDSCGLSRAEAELVKLLNSKQATTC